MCLPFDLASGSDQMLVCLLTGQGILRVKPARGRHAEARHATVRITVLQSVPPDIDIASGDGAVNFAEVRLSV